MRMIIKKYLFSLVLILACNYYSLYAQTPITITASSMPSSGDTIRYSNSTPNGLDYLSTGQNYFWDFSNLNFVNQDIFQYKAASQTPYAFYFIGLNKYGLKVADSLGAATFKFYDVYNFYQKTTSVFKTEGTGFKFNGIPLAAYYSDDDELYQFPLNFNDRDSSTYAYSISLGPTLSYSQKGYRINEVDGWGYIKTPYDSLPCLRLVSTSFGEDSLNVNGFPVNFPNVQRSYKWLSSTEKIPVLEISGQLQNNNFTPTQVRYRDTYRPAIGINEITKKNILKLYPNPSSNEINIDFKEISSGIISISDMYGREIFNQKISYLDKFKLATSSFISGIYYVKYTNTNGNSFVSSFIKLND
jgi:hypothetical protein